MALSLKQTKAVDLMFTGKTVVEIAAELGIHRNTLYKWLKAKDFKNAIETMRAALTDTFFNALVSTYQTCLRNVLQALHSENELLRAQATFEVFGKLFSGRSPMRVRRDWENLRELGIVDGYGNFDEKVADRELQRIIDEVDEEDAARAEALGDVDECIERMRRLDVHRGLIEE